MLLGKCEKKALATIKVVGIQHPTAYFTALDLLELGRGPAISRLDTNFREYYWNLPKANNLKEEQELATMIRNLALTLQTEKVAWVDVAWYLIRHRLMQSFSDRMLKDYNRARHHLYDAGNPLHYSDSIGFMIEQTERFVRTQTELQNQRSVTGDKPKVSTPNPQPKSRQGKNFSVHAQHSQGSSQPQFYDDSAPSVTSGSSFAVAGAPYKSPGRKKATPKSGGKTSEVKHGIVQDDCPFCITKEGRMAYSHRYYRQCPRLRTDHAEALSDEKIRDIVAKTKRCRLCLGTQHGAKSCTLPAKYDCTNCSKPNNRHFRTFCGAAKGGKPPKGSSGKKTVATVGTVTCSRPEFVVGPGGHRHATGSMAASANLKDGGQ